MKVTPTKRLGKYRPGDEFEMRDKMAKALIKAGKLRAAPTYSTRMLTADPASVPAVAADPVEPIETETVAEVSEGAPYGYKADGTPRKRPGRPRAEDSTEGSDE